MLKTQRVLLSQIRMDSVSARCELKQEWINTYTVRMKSGAKFPPVVLFQEGDEYWIGDGFYRIHAALKVPGKLDIDAHVVPGNKRDALLYAVGANQ